MVKKMDDSVADAMLNKIATATMLTVCAAEPLNFADIATQKLADDAVAGADFTNANGDTSGRKVTVGQQADMPIDTSGTATHVALDDGVTLLYVTTCTSQALTAGGTVTVPAWDIEVADPT